MQSLAAQNGQELFELRQARGWSLQRAVTEIRRHPELGIAYVVSARQIDRIERGEVASPNLATQFALAKLYGREPKDFWPRELPARRRPRRQAVAA